MKNRIETHKDFSNTIKRIKELHPNFRFRYAYTLDNNQIAFIFHDYDFVKKHYQKPKNIILNI